jgi:hypothetical protein
MLRIKSIIRIAVHVIVNLMRTHKEAVYMAKRLTKTHVNVSVQAAIPALAAH